MIKIIIFICSVYSCGAFYKKWINYNTTNMENWNDKFTISKDIYLPSNLHTSFLIHRDGAECELVFSLTEDKDNQIPYTDESDIIYIESDCPYETLDHVPTHAYWIDPRNWVSDYVNEATPDLEKLPCIYDTVQFENITNLFVTLPDDTISVNRIYVNYYVLSELTYAFMIRSDLRNITKHFINTSDRDLTDIIQVKFPRDCQRIGCECGTAKFYKKSCELIKDSCPTVEQLHCTLPIRPVNHCCEICGTHIIVIFKPNTLIYYRFQNKIDKIVSNITYNDNEVAVYYSKISNDRVQIVIVDKNKYRYHSKTSTIADVIIQTLGTSSSSSVNSLLGLKYTRMIDYEILQTIVKSSEPPLSSDDFDMILEFIFISVTASISLIVAASYIYCRTETKKMFTMLKSPLSKVTFTNVGKKVNIKTEEQENLASEYNIQDDDQNHEIMEEDEINPKDTVYLLDTS